MRQENAPVYVVLRALAHHHLREAETRRSGGNGGDVGRECLGLGGCCERRGRGV